MVQILTGSLNPEDQPFKIRTKAIAIAIAKPNIWKPDLQKVWASNVSRFQIARFQIPTVQIVVYFKDKFLTNFNSIFDFFKQTFVTIFLTLKLDLTIHVFPQFSLTTTASRSARATPSAATSTWTRWESHSLKMELISDKHFQYRRVKKGYPSFLQSFLKYVFYKMIYLFYTTCLIV